MTFLTALTLQNCNGETGIEQDNDDVAKPIDFVLYYESMCPYCRKLITQQLYPTFKAVSSAVLNITLVPYGFGQVGQML